MSRASVLRHASVGLTLVFFGCSIAACSRGSSKIEQGFLGGAGEEVPTLPFRLEIPFTAGTEANYLFNDTEYDAAMNVEMTNGKVRLKPMNQTDDVNNSFADMTHSGTRWDSTAGVVRLNATINNSELDDTWAPLWTSLVGYWKLNVDGADSKSSLSGTATGTVTFTTNSKVGAKAGVFDGSSYYTIADATTLDNTSKLSVAFWVKPTTLDETARGVVSKRTGDGTQESYALYFGASNKLYVDIDGNGDRFSSTTTFFPAQWYHVVLVFDGSLAAAQRAKLYVNGVLDKTSTESSSAISDYASNFYLGYLGGGGGLIGHLDEVALWRGGALTPNEVRVAYDRQLGKFSGVATSRVINAGSSQAWESLAITTPRPFGKELPATSESSTHYSALTGSTGAVGDDNLMSGLIGLWHFNETSGTFADSAPGGLYPATAANSPTRGVPGILGSAVRLSRASTQSLTTPSINVGASFTLSIWAKINTTTAEWQSLISNSGSSGHENGWQIGLNTWGSSDGVVQFGTGNGTLGAAAKSAAGIATPSVWHHYAVVVDRTAGSSKIYVDGVQVNVGSTATRTDFKMTGIVYFGRLSDGSGLIDGSIDEAAIWGRQLQASEVMEVYRRGANRLKYQVRSCANANCSDQEALTTLGRGWKGPDNTSSSYFSELHNNVAVDSSGNPSGSVKTGAFNVLFSAFSSVLPTPVSVPNQPYFQYRAIFESEDSNAQCSYSGAANCSPEIKTIAVGPTHYPVSQTITSKASIGSLFQSLDGSGFTPNGVSCAQDVRYTLSRDGTSFYYLVGSAWTLSSGTYVTASPASAIAAHLASFPAAVGVGTLQIKMFLSSDGTTTCEVDNLSVTGRRP